MYVHTQAAMAKLYSSQVAEKTASKCIEWMGGAGTCHSLSLSLSSFNNDTRIQKQKK
jgi:alkylation response protein AidB-like acyl-CoA dehydrogenase